MKCLLLFQSFLIIQTARSYFVDSSTTLFNDTLSDVNREIPFSVSQPTTTGNGITTPQPVQTGITASCNAFYLVKLGDQCGDIASSHAISLSLFYTWNPAVGITCNYLIAGDYVCIGILTGSSTTPTVNITTSSPSISTPTPIQPGMIGACNAFYLVKTGDVCSSIAASFNISLPQFYLYNPGVNSVCTNMIGGDYVCVGSTASSTTSSTTTISPTSGNAISTPTPTQTGMVTNCLKFHYVVGGDECGGIASNAGITLADFYLWNPGVGSSCGSLWLNYYVCIGV